MLGWNNNSDEAGTMQHYFNPMSRGITTHWMLLELEAEHEPVVVDFQAGESQTPDYLAMNPMGKVPMLVDDGVVVTEVAAICTYLADKFPAKNMAPPLDSNQRGKYYRYLFFPGTTLEPMFTARQFGLEDTAATGTAGWGDFEHCLASIDAMTPDSDWVLGETFSAADVVFGGFLDFAVTFGWLVEPSAKVSEYLARLKARPAYRASHDESWY